jgi:C1A family cysteine protease
MKTFTALLVAALGLASASELNVHSAELKELWGAWKSLNNKSYAEVEEVHKFSTFVENFVKVATHNKQNSDVKLALNQFADMTDEEFKKYYASGLILDEYAMLREQLESHTIDYSILQTPESVDWREKGAVTPVKNQGQCGSCWSFSSTGALEGLNFVKTGKLLSFSEQQLVDCDKKDQGCNGGLMDNAFAYTAKQGIATEEDYPYKAVGGRCQYNASKANKVNTSFKDVPAKNVDALKAALAVQPVSVAIQADQAAFRFYKSGVIKASCGAALNHGVLAVGYTTENGEEAFIVKNSWGETWGTKGYTLISTDGKANSGAGVCGILKMSSYPTA